MRALFLFAALFVSVSVWCSAQASTSVESSPVTTAVLFDFRSAVPETYWQDLRSELEQNAAPIWPNREMLWMKREEFHAGMEFPEVVQVRLQGHCKADLTTSWEYSDGPLGYVYRIDGEIQPVVYVNCDRIGHALERELRGASATERRQKFMRAISRVVAHELTHIFTQSEKHSSRGLQQARLTANELTNAAFRMQEKEKAGSSPAKKRAIQNDALAVMDGEWPLGQLP